MEIINRHKLEAKYSVAIAKMKVAGTVDDFMAAEAEVQQLRWLLIQYEQAYPTKAETRRAADRLRLRNRGLDA